MLLLGLKHRQQTQDDCLAACASIVLEYLGISYDYNHLMRILETAEGGAPFTNLKRLESTFNLPIVEGRNREDISLFAEYISTGLPVIVAVQTWPLPYWQQFDAAHAVIVVGFNQDEIYLYDPYFSSAPQVVDLQDFLTAWSERDFEYAVIRLTDA